MEYDSVQDNQLGLKGQVYCFLSLTFKVYQIQSIVSDNASNNDMMMEELRVLFFDQGIVFNTKNARGQYLPHIVHLTAIKILQIIIQYFQLLLSIGGLSEYKQ